MKLSYKYLLITLFMVYCHPCFSSDDAITFPDACSKGPSIVIAAVGDVLLHTPLQVKGMQNGFDSLWQEALPYIQNVDIAYANLEGPIAEGMKRRGDNTVYSDFPYFNYHPEVAFALKKSGFTIVSTANNHVLDRFSLGIDKTIQALDKAGMTHVGTRERGTDQPWVRILTKNNLKIAWIACTETTNDNPDVYHQVLHCYRRSDRQEILNTIDDLKHRVDAIIVTPHWGEEWHTKPNEEQIVFAHRVLDQGATAVIGSHPHVLQPIKKYITKDGRSTLIVYSLGNFVSFQGSPIQRSTIILLLGLTKNANGTVINGVKFVPMYMQNRSGTSSIHLTRIPLNNNDSIYQIFSNVMPMENMLSSQAIVTNPECQGNNMVHGTGL